MNEPRKAGRPKKHLENEHHFHAASEVATQEDVVENPSDQSLDISDIFADASNISTELPEAPASKEVIVEDVVPRLSSEYVTKPEVINLNGWHSMNTEIVLHQPPRNGMPVRLSETPDGNGTTAFWRRTRAFNGKKYEETGVWTDYITSAAIPFIPKYWKERFN